MCVDLLVKYMSMGINLKFKVEAALITTNVKKLSNIWWTHLPFKKTGWTHVCIPNFKIEFRRHTTKLLKYF